MAVHINILNGGNITITTGSSTPSGHPETRFTLEGGTVETHNIEGALNLNWMSSNGYYDNSVYNWIKNIVSVDIGNNVTELSASFYDLFTLANVTIPNSVTYIGDDTFKGCYALTSLTLPDTVDVSGIDSFQGCSGLETITITANGGDANGVKQSIINSIGDESISDNITWNMPS